MKARRSRTAALLARGVLLTVLLCIALGFVAVNAVAYKRANDLVHPAKSPANTTPASLGLNNFKDIRYKTADGVTIAAWYIPGRNNAAVILVNGFAGNRAQLLPEAQMLNAAGLHTLLIDCRTCGDSNGRLNTFGLNEIEDVRGAIEYLENQPAILPDRIGVAGRSEGGATALLAAASIQKVHAVAAISTFTSLRDNVDSGVRHLLNLPPFPFAPLLVFWGERISGIDLDQVSPIERIARISPRPVLIIHGEQDELMPLENGQRLYATAKEPKKLVIIPGAGHDNIRQVGGDMYKNALVGFFTEKLAP